MDQEIIGKGWNIKCFDKIKLTHIATNYRIHANTFGYKSGSYNYAVSAQKMRDQSDWFVVLRPQQPSISYHFHYADEIILKNAEAKKNLHLSQEHESAISKGMEVSLCDQQDRNREHHNEDEWIVESAETSQDHYWRVGQILRIKNKDSLAYLCSHRRKIRQNEDFEIFGEVIRLQKEVSTLSESEKQRWKQVNDKCLWMVSQILPFVYTATISEKKRAKSTEQAEQLLKLNKSKHSIPTKGVKKLNESQQILRMESVRLEQLQSERKKMLQYERKLSCWKKYCCCCLNEDDDYKKIE